MLKSSGLTRQLEDMVTLDRPGNRPAIELPAEPVPYTRSPKRVLIVEDNLDSVHTLVWLVRDMGHSVEYAINGYVGVDLARKNRPDIVLLDLGLPGLDGFEVCSRLKHEAGMERLRVIVITGYASDEHRVRSRAAGCETHLVKPVAVDTLFQVLESDPPAKSQ